MNKEIKNVKLSFKCPVDYHAMPDAEGGKFCNHCQKTVYDFTNTKADVFRQILAEHNNSICGRFSARQMAVQQPYFKPVWKKRLSAAMVLMGFNIWGGKIMAQTGKQPTPHNQSNDTITDPSYIGEVVIDIRKLNDTTATFGPVGTDPEFPGGPKMLSHFIKSNLHPVSNTKGRVLVTFVVEKTGTLTNFRVVRSLNKQADAEAIRILKLSPKWQPGIQIGKPIRVQYTVPVVFE